MMAKRPLVKFILPVLALAIVIVGLAIAFMRYFEFPGGMPPDYRAADFDPQLTPIARDAAPIIASINRFYAAHGKCPQTKPGDLVELHAGLANDVSATVRGDDVEFRKSNASSGWSYSSSPDATACTLSRKLGWDPSLVWQRNGGQARWVFVPGDGSADKPIRLDGGGS
jgi:hypothetical protein